MINRRGALVVVLVVLAWGFGSYGGEKTERAKWQADWTRLSSTGMLCKGDKLK